MLAALPAVSIKAGTMGGAATAAANASMGFTGTGVMSILGSLASSAASVSVADGVSGPHFETLRRPGS